MTWVLVFRGKALRVFQFSDALQWSSRWSEQAVEQAFGQTNHHEHWEHHQEGCSSTTYRPIHIIHQSLISQPYIYTAHFSYVKRNFQWATIALILNKGRWNFVGLGRMLRRDYSAIRRQGDEKQKGSAICIKLSHIKWCDGNEVDINTPDRCLICPASGLTLQWSCFQWNRGWRLRRRASVSIHGCPYCNLLFPFAST